jgi:hypothetical protein
MTAVQLMTSGKSSYKYHDDNGHVSKCSTCDKAADMSNNIYIQTSTRHPNPSISSSTAADAHLSFHCHIQHRWANVQPNPAVARISQGLPAEPAATANVQQQTGNAIWRKSQQFQRSLQQEAVQQKRMKQCPSLFACFACLDLMQAAAHMLLQACC